MRLIAVALLIVAQAGCGARDLAPIRLEPLATIGAEDGDGAMATWPRVSARHPGGYRILVPQPGAVSALPIVFADDGTFLGTLGTRGDGPGDFVEPLFARLGPGDSIWVFDGAQRVLVFGPDREFARSVTLPVAPWDAVVLASGELAVTPAVFGAPLPWLLLDRDGNLLRQIGSSDGTVPTPRRIIAGPNGTVWTLAMTHRWLHQQWDLEGNLLETLVLAPDWYTAHDELLGPGPDRPPQSAVQDGWVDTGGRLWIVGKATDPNWRDGVTIGSSGNASVADPDKVYDTVVDVFDPSNGATLAEARFDGAYPFTAEPGVLMRVVTTTAGWHRAELARLLVDTTRLVRQGAKP